MRAPVLMVQGTASSVGKSIVTTGLCRLLRNRGYRVAPFKAQNMALNAHVTTDGGEIGRAQAVQAEAAGCVPTVDMNPILLKPEGPATSQVIVHGRPIGTMSARDYHASKQRLRGLIAESLERLRAAYDVVVMEGAGSPAEINLKTHDIVNMDVARRAGAPVLLVGDIDRGGVFAALVGTLELLPPPERRLVAGFVINKFRGDPEILRPGLDLLVERTGVPVLGVLPYLAHLRVPEEDSVSLDDRPVRRGPGEMLLEIAVVRLPRISNHDDFAPLEHEPGVTVRFAEQASTAEGADLLILPGSKCTVADLLWLRERGWADLVRRRAAQGEPVLGICGGCQMLGERIEDPEGIESERPLVDGLGLLPLRTRFASPKVTAQVALRPGAPCFLTEGLPTDQALKGYEIHTGGCEPTDSGVLTPFRSVTRNGAPADIPDGAISCDGAVVGTLVHGLFENDGLRKAMLRTLHSRAGRPGPPARQIATRSAAYDRLAAMLEQHLDLPGLYRTIGLSDRSAGHST